MGWLLLLEEEVHYLGVWLILHLGPLLESSDLATDSHVLVTFGLGNCSALDVGLPQKRVGSFGWCKVHVVASLGRKDWTDQGLFVCLDRGSGHRRRWKCKEMVSKAAIQQLAVSHCRGLLHELTVIAQQLCRVYRGNSWNEKNHFASIMLRKPVLRFGFLQAAPRTLSGILLLGKKLLFCILCPLVVTLCVKQGKCCRGRWCYR